PIIFVTAMSQDATNVFRGYEHGAVDYLFKPFDPEILRRKIAVFVDLFRKGEEIKRQADLLRAQALEALDREMLYESEPQARRQAEATIETREHILAVVSHDLKNPLHAILASTAVLSRHRPPGDAGTHFDRHRRAIVRAADRM